MEDKAPDKEAIPDTLGGVGEEGHDPYLDQLDSSLEDLGDEEATRYDIPADTPAPGNQLPPEAPLDPMPATPEEPPATPAPTMGMDEALENAAAIPVSLRVVIGDRATTLGELLKLKKGELLELDRGLDSAVDLMVQDKVVARGELVEIDGRMGVRIIRIFENAS